MKKINQLIFMKGSLLFLLNLLIIGSIGAQDYQNQLSEKRKKEDYGFYNIVSARYHHGRFLKNSESLDDIMDNPYDSYDIRVGFQGNGVKQKSDKLYGFPVYGVGFYHIFFEGGELGAPQALYIFIRAPIFTRSKISMTWELATGLAYGFYKYDPTTNPDQQVIGSEHNVYFNAAAGVTYHLNKRFDLTFDFDLSHFSNGSTRTPNQGINLVGLALGGRYNFNPVKNYTKAVDPSYQPSSRPVFERSPIEKYQRHSEILISANMGGKTTTTQIYDGPTYFIASLSVDYAWAYHHVGALGAGLDGFYESALRDYPVRIEDPSFSDLSYAGWHISHYLKMYRLELITQLGFYLTNNVDHKGNTYIRAGGRFNITDKFYAGASLKTRNGAVADFIEWGIGYRIPFAFAKK